MAESTGYESGDPRYGEVPFGTVTEYDPSMDDDSQDIVRKEQQMGLLQDQLQQMKRLQTRGAYKTYDIASVSMSVGGEPLRSGDMVSINARGELAATAWITRTSVSVPFGGYRVGDRITLADGMQGTVTDVGPDDVYTMQLDGATPESVTGTIGQSSRDPDNRRLRERAPQEMAFARNFFLAVKDAWREELRERARSFAHSTPSPLPDGDARYKGCQGRALRAGTLCESRKVRCVAHRHGLLSIAPRKPGRVTSCRAV